MYVYIYILRMQIACMSWNSHQKQLCMQLLEESKWCASAFAFDIPTFNTDKTFTDWTGVPRTRFD